MVRQRESIIFEEPGWLGGPTRYPTSENKYQFRCGQCNELYYIDEPTNERFSTAMQENPGDSPFLCEDCEVDYRTDERP